MKFFTSFLLLVSFVTVATAIVCRPNACATVLCQRVTKEDCAPNQVYEPRGGYCGCCAVCVTLLGEGDNCRLTQLRGGPPPTEKCGDGLYCDSETRTCLPEDDDDCEWK